MLFGRFLMIVPMLAIAGNLAKKKLVPPSAGRSLCILLYSRCLLVGVILIVGALTFFPALSLGPILEHLLCVPAKASDAGVEGSRSTHDKYANAPFGTRRSYVAHWLMRWLS